MQAPGGLKTKHLFPGVQGIHVPKTDGRIQLIILNNLKRNFIVFDSCHLIVLSLSCFHVKFFIVTVMLSLGR